MGRNLIDEFQEQYIRSTPKSKSYFEAAMKLLPGGCTRNVQFFKPYPPYIDRGKGFRVIDVDGNERIDFFNNASSLILGHANPLVVKAVQEQLLKGTAFHAPTPLEVELASILCKRLSSVERVRFTNSGSEACMMVLRAAKAFTGKNKIGKMEGGYHGICDYACVSVHPDLDKAGPPESPWSLPESEGISDNILKEVVVMPFNNSDAVEKIVKKEKDNLACIIVEPMQASAGIIPAKKEFLEDLRKITEKYGLLLIFDEVQTFRHSEGGAQQLCNVKPDLTALGKTIGGGFPIGAFGGKKEIMEVYDCSSGKARVSHHGTFNGNPISMVAGITTLKQLTPETYAQLNRLGEELRNGLSDLFQKYECKACVTGEASFFRIHFTAEKILDLRSAMTGVNKVKHQELFFYFLNHGIFVDAQLRGNLSLPMGKPQIDKVLNVVEDYLKE